MFEDLLAVIAGDARLGEDQVALIRSLFIPRAVAIGWFFQRAGEVTSRGPAVERRYRLGLQRGRAARDRRIALALRSSAEERYLDFLEMYPSLAERVPQHMLASYLGVMPETLSRVRRKIQER
jgi:CRP-like cAMP-binding protein